MKTLIAMSLVMLFAFTRYSGTQQPKAIYQVGSAKITVWENKQPSKEGEITVKNFVVEKVYKEGQEQKANNQFNEAELIQLKETIDKVINAENVKNIRGEELTKFNQELPRLIKEAEEKKK